MIQDGARRHYIVPQALHAGGMLERMFTDWYVRGMSIESVISKLMRFYKQDLCQKMMGRRCDGLDDSLVYTNPWLAIRNSLAAKRFSVIEEYYDWVSQRNADWILKKGFGKSTHIYGYVRNVHPSLFRTVRNQGMKTIGDQIIAPAEIEFLEYEKQQTKWPGWEPYVEQGVYKLLDRIERETWEASDFLVCGSDYVKTCMIDCGISSDRVHVIPYAPSGSNLSFKDRRHRKGPVIVGFVGSVNLRKGTPAFFEIAKRFDPQKVRFVMVGSVHINRHVAEREKGHVELIGGVPRSHVHKWLWDFDLFLFPSTCEGCAGSVLEAMDTGLPIVSTPSSGTVVRHGIDGYLHNCNDVDGMTQSILRLVDDPDLRLKMGWSARTRIELFDQAWYLSALRNLLN